MSVMRRLGICLLNISEGRNSKIMESVARAATSSNHPVPGAEAEQDLKCKSTVLNIFSDYDYNRSVLTIVAPLCHLAESLYRACREAYSQIDLGQQSGIHPRLGAVDLIPIYPLSGDVTVEECGMLAKDVASRLARDVPGTSFFLFGTADLPMKRDLVARRKQVGWFMGQHEMDYSKLQHDVGTTPSRRYGLTGAGGSLYVTNYNVTIATQDVSIGKEIARRIRSTSPGGLPGVKVMAFSHEGNTEIACNVEHIPSDSDASDTRTSKFKMSDNDEYLDGRADTKSAGAPQRDTYHDVRYTSPAVIEARVKTLAAEYGIGLVGTSVIGFKPQEAYELAVHALLTRQAELWRTRVPGTVM